MKNMIALICLSALYLVVLEAPARAQPTTAPVRWSPPSAGTDGFTWVQLVSGEWVKGEIKDLRDGNLRFDSDELGEFDYDWADVRAVISSAPHTVTTWERQVYTGFVHARRDSIRILDASGAEIAVVSPDDVSSMIEGRPTEWNYWSGSLSMGTTVRSGNSDQSEFNSLVKLDRQALVTRWDNTASVSAAASGGEKTQETHRYSSTFDYFLDRNVFVRVAGYEFFRDPFQNIRQRHTAGASVGYDANIRAAEMDYTVGAAWQGLQYDSVQPGADSTVDYWVGRFALGLDWDLTADVEFELDYGINVPFEDANAYSSNLLTTLSLDVWWNLEFDFTFAWDRQNDPQPDADGIRPQKDDYRLVSGLSWDF